MKLLLDTHIFLWGLLDPERLSPSVTIALKSPKNELWLSPISVWEALLLAERGRIQVGTTPATWMAKALRQTRLREAPLTHDIALASRDIDLPHQDPADRFLAATAKVHEMTLVTADQKLIACPGIGVLANR